MTGVDEIAAWRANHLAPRPGSVPADGESHAARLLRNKADTEGEKAAALRLKNAQRRGELVERAEIVREFAEFLTHARAILDTLPDDIATETPHDLRPRMHAIAKASVDRMLQKLSSWQPSAVELSDE